MTEYTLKTFLREPFSPTNQQTLLTNLFGDTLTVFTQPQLLIEAADNIRGCCTTYLATIELVAYI